MSACFNLSKTAAVASGVTASLLFAAPVALAQNKPVVVYAQPHDLRIERVSYSDLNLTADDQQKTLYRRVGSAVRRVCAADGGNIADVDQDYRLCAGVAWKDARPQIDRAVARSRELALNGGSLTGAAVITVRVR